MFIILLYTCDSGLRLALRYRGRHCIITCAVELEHDQIQIMQEAAKSHARSSSAVWCINREWLSRTNHTCDESREPARLVGGVGAHGGSERATRA